MHRTNKDGRTKMGIGITAFPSEYPEPRIGASRSSSIELVLFPAGEHFGLLQRFRLRYATIDRPGQHSHRNRRTCACRLESGPRNSPPKGSGGCGSQCLPSLHPRISNDGPRSLRGRFPENIGPDHPQPCDVSAQERNRQAGIAGLAIAVGPDDRQRPAMGSLLNDSRKAFTGLRSRL